MHSLHLLDNVIILRRVAKPIALFCTDKSPKHCLIQINMKRLHQDLELNIYRNIYHSGDISSIMIVCMCVCVCAVYIHKYC